MNRILSLFFLYLILLPLVAEAQFDSLWEKEHQRIIDADKLPDYFAELYKQKFNGKAHHNPQHATKKVEDNVWGLGNGNYLYSNASIVMLPNKQFQFDRERPGRKMNIVLEKTFYDKPVMIDCDEEADSLVISDCYFKQAVYITGKYKTILFDHCVFDGLLRIGGIKDERWKGKVDILSNVLFHSNFFRLGIEMDNAVFHGSCEFYGSYIQETDLKNCRFEQPLHFGSCEIISTYRFTNNISDNVRYSDCLFNGPYRSTFNRYSQIALNACSLAYPHDRLEGNMILGDTISRALTISNSTVKRLLLTKSYWEKDSAILSFASSTIGRVSIKDILYPYLIDLTRLKFADKSNQLVLGIDYRIKHAQDAPVPTLRSFGNPKTYLYLDETDVENIDCSFKHFVLGSVYYDPSVQDVTEPEAFHPSHKITNLHTNETIDPGSILFASVATHASVVPFPDSVWAKKNVAGIKAKEKIFKDLLRKFENNHDTWSYRSVDLALKHFELLEVNPTLFNRIVYYCQLYWWEFGYRKEYVFLWMIFFLLAFSLVNLKNLRFLNLEVYKIPRIFERLQVNDRYQRRWGIGGNRHSIQVSDLFSRKFPIVIGRLWHNFKIDSKNLFLSIMYTGFIFFGLKMDTGKFAHKSHAGTAWILLIYTVGIICLGFAFNLIIS